MAFTDKDLIERMAQGDQDALCELMRRHQQRVYRIGLAYLRDPEEALEVVQEAFVKAYRNAARWDGSSEVAAWLARIAINESIDHYRRARRRRAAEEPLDPGGGQERWAEGSPSPERRLLGRELGERLDGALRSLPERQRAIFVLRHYEGLELREIAQALGMRLGTVKSGLHRALSRLRELLREVVG